MKYLILLILIIVIAGGIYYKSQNLKFSPSLESQNQKQTEPTKITAQQAIEKVKSKPEVQDFLKRVPKGKVEIDNELEGEYNVHVYEVKDGHTATFNWYRVNSKSGEIRAEFSFPVSTGTISGKLCYPSEVLPKGRLEIKNISTGKLDYEDYPGSLNGGKNTYSLQLEEGDYYLRYNVAENLIGYSTTVCPTGNEKTCADTKQRILVKASVLADETISNYDLCDYYYKDSNAPKF